jgi:hypothetical protein
MHCLKHSLDYDADAECPICTVEDERDRLKAEVEAMQHEAYGVAHCQVLRNRLDIAKGNLAIATRLLGEGDIERLLRNQRVEELEAALALQEPLRAALAEALFTHPRSLIHRVCVDPDPDAATYDVDWTEKAKAWMALCGIDPDERDPSPYVF